MAKFLLTICALLLGQGVLLAQDSVDTLRFRGKCQYIGKTYSHLGTTYFRFKVVEVLEGSCKDDFVVFEGSINSRQYQLFEKVKEGKKLSNEADVSKIFPISYVRVSDIFKCTSEVIELKLSKAVDWPEREMMTFVPDSQE